MDNLSNFNSYYEQMHQALILQGKQPKTVESYLRTLRRVRDRLHKPLDKLKPTDLKMYFAELLDTHSWSTVKIDRCALVFFYTHVLEREWQWIKIVKAPQVKTIPDVLTQDETIQLLNQLEKPRYKACLAVIYSMGLRISEALRLTPADICSKTMRVHIRNSKGNKDRLVPLPAVTLHLLRAYWATHRNPNLIFPKFSGTAYRISKTIDHMDKGGVQGAMKAALADSGISKKITVHSLRHSYATHLIEIGVNLRIIQEILGHSSPVTTAIYAQISKPAIDDSKEAINLLMQNLANLL